MPSYCKCTDWLKVKVKQINRQKNMVRRIKKKKVTVVSIIKAKPKLKLVTKNKWKQLEH